MNQYIKDEEPFYSLKNIIADIIQLNPQLVTNNSEKEIEKIIDFLQVSIMEILPNSIRKIQSLRVMSPFQKKILEYRLKRHGEAYQKKYKTQDSYFPEEIIRGVNASLLSYNSATGLSQDFSTTNIEKISKTSKEYTLYSAKDRLIKINKFLVNTDDESQDIQAFYQNSGTIFKKKIIDKKRTPVLQLSPNFKHQEEFQIKSQFISIIEESLCFLSMDNTTNYFLDFKEVPDLIYILKIEMNTYKIENFNEIKEQIFQRLTTESQQLNSSNKEDFSNFLSRLYITYTLDNDNFTDLVKNNQLGNKNLNITDLEKIYNFFRNSNNLVDLNNLFLLLQKNLKIRNKKYNVDCIKELNRFYLNDDDENHTIVSSHSSIQISINEILRAIMLHEYYLGCEEQRQSFLNKKITYEQYEQKVDDYTKRVFQLC